MRTIYRMSIDASICFDVEAASEQEAIEKAREYINNEQPECFEIGDARQTCVYPGGVDENLEVQSWFQARENGLIAS